MFLWSQIIYSNEHILRGLSVTGSETGISLLELEALCGHELLSLLECLHPARTKYSRPRLAVFACSQKHRSARHNAQKHTFRYVFVSQCPRLDLNQHAFRHIHLKDACLPISTPGQGCKGEYTRKPPLCNPDSCQNIQILPKKRIPTSVGILF